MCELAFKIAKCGVLVLGVVVLTDVEACVVPY